MFIYNDDKELFRKCREIWNKITELIGINNAPDFVENNLMMMMMMMMMMKNLLQHVHTKIQALLKVIKEINL